jgi:HD superfamily phosphodiesterase
MLISHKYNIDESHSLGHSLDVLNHAHNIYESELPGNPHLKLDERVIYVSAIIHDMCDKKYIDQEEGIYHIQHFLKEKMTYREIQTVKNIITTMSYSHIKENGFPNLGEKQLAYNIVRESDLLSAYDFNRCILYKLYKQKSGNIDEAFDDAHDLFNIRILKYGDNGLFTTEYAKKESFRLHSQSLTQINNWKKILKKPHI